MKRQAIVLGLGLLSVPSCNGTETGNPPVALDGFDTTGCKSDNHASIKLPAIALKSVQKGDRAVSEAAANELRYSGRSCLVWERTSEETLEIALVNYVDGCHADEGWEPRVDLSEDGTLNLRMENPECIAGGCGWCIYDLAFRVRLHDVPDELTVKLWDDGCGGGAQVQHQTSLRLAREQQGEACVWANKYALEERCPHSADDYLYRPCAARGALCGAETCPDGLSCHEVAEADARCVPSCSSDADCAPYAGTRCKEQLCLL